MRIVQFDLIVLVCSNAKMEERWHLWLREKAMLLGKPDGREIVGTVLIRKGEV